MVPIGLLEVLALTLAHLHWLGGVRTDEAKYLLNIPYPHPPLGRFLLHLFEWLPDPEAFLRMVLATLVVQSMWFIWDIGRDCSHRERMGLCLTWILSAAVFTQAGTLMMAPITAVQMLVLLWMESRIHTLPHEKTDRPQVRYAILIALVWLASLFTAYQAVLFAPLVWNMVAKLRRSLWETVFYVLGPVVALVIYTFAHPIILATFVIHSGEASSSVLLQLWNVGTSLVIAGSFFGTLAALVGLYRYSSWGLRLSAILLFLSFLPSFHSFYTILWTPIILGGVHAWMKAEKTDRLPYQPALAAAAVVLIALTAPWSFSADARAVSDVINAKAGTGGLVLMRGPFGHEWQYENTRSVRSFRDELLPRANAVVCTKSCRDVTLPGFTLAEKLPKTFTGELWIRSRGTLPQ